MLNSNWLLNKLRDTTEPCIGTWITIPSPELVDVICSAGPDFIVIDTEHSPISLETAQLMSIVCASREVSPVYRVPDVIQDRIVPALEIGSHGIQAPNISTIEDAKAFRDFSKYRPIGAKGLSPFTRACNYSGEFASQMISDANQNTLLVAQVEGREGIENIESILTVSEIDICFLGLYDLSNYLQIPGQLGNPRLLRLFGELVNKINDAGVIVGSISSSKEQLDFLIRSGVRYITHSADCEITRKSYSEIFGSVKHEETGG